jgi:hypothetical protein
VLYAQTEVFSSQRDTKEASLYQQMHRSVHTETADIFKRVRKIEKMTTAFVMSVRMGNIGCHWTIFREV